MNDGIRLSVIVPVYNLEEYLAGTLDSLLEIEADDPYEIIAVDDGSRDGSTEILREYETKHDNIRVITQANGGVARARNTGIEAARGEYITFVDGDDTVCPGFFREAIREAETGGYDIVQGHILYTDGEQIRFRAPGCERRESSDPEELMEWFFGRSETLTFNSTAKVFRRETVGEIRFTPGIQIGEDMRFDYEILRKKPKVLILDLDAYRYIDRDSSVLHSQYVERGWDAIRVLEFFESDDFTDSPRVRKQLKKLKTDILVKIYNTATLTGKSGEKALAEIRKYDIGAIRETLSKKEYAKLVLLQKMPAAYNALLKAVK